MNIQEVWNIHNRLLRLYQRMEQLLESMEKQRFCFQESNVTQDLVQTVRKKEKEMEGQLEFLRSMGLALEQILCCYEKEIMQMEEHLDGRRLHMPTAKVEKLRVKAIKQMLQDLED